MFRHPVFMPRWHKWICDYNPAEYERVPKGYISHQIQVDVLRPGHACKRKVSHSLRNNCYRRHHYYDSFDSGGRTALRWRRSSGDFKCATPDEFYAKTLEKQSDLVAFREGRGPFGQHFSKMRQFCAGIASFFPGTSTVVFDFRVLY
jgi:hypothetical protein